MKKIISILLITVAIFSFSACGGVDVKTDNLATQEEIYDLINSKKEHSDNDFSVEFVYKYESLQMDSNSKVKTTYSIKGTASYKYNSQLKKFDTPDLKCSGKYVMESYIPTIVKVQKNIITLKEEAVSYLNDKGVNQIFSSYSKNGKGEGYQSKVNKKQFGSYNRIYSNSIIILNTYVLQDFFKTKLNSAHFVFTSGNDVYTVSSYTNRQQKIMFRFKNDVLTKCVIEYNSSEENYTVELNYMSFVEIKEPKNKTDYEGYKA